VLGAPACIRGGTTAVAGAGCRSVPVLLPVPAGPLLEQGAAELAAGLKVLAYPVRLRILVLIRQAPELRVRTLDLATDLGVTQPAHVDLSGHHSQPQPSLVPRLPPASLRSRLPK
jgi:hypothetical protein